MTSPASSSASCRRRCRARPTSTSSACIPATAAAAWPALLYERFFALAAAHGATVVSAVTAPANERSIAFHAALGFTVSDPLPGYDGPGDVKVRFERPLA